MHRAPATLARWSAPPPRAPVRRAWVRVGLARRLAAPSGPPRAARGFPSVAAPSPVPAPTRETPGFFSPPRPARLAPPLCAASSDSHPVPLASGSDASSSHASGWVLVGCDSDAGGALAIVRGPSVGVVASVEVIDCPTVKVEVNGKLRTRLHAEAMVAALASLRLPRAGWRTSRRAAWSTASPRRRRSCRYNFGLWRGVSRARGWR